MEYYKVMQIAAISPETEKFGEVLGYMDSPCTDDEVVFYLEDDLLQTGGGIQVTEIVQDVVRDAFYASFVRVTAIETHICGEDDLHGSVAPWATDKVGYAEIRAYLAVRYPDIVWNITIGDDQDGKKWWRARRC